MKKIYLKNSIKKIIHFSDIHIRLYKRKEEYIKVFENLYKTLNNISDDNTLIVITGDIIHTKIELSPEMVSMTYDMLKKVSDIAPTILIAGNHDANLNNKNRLDALTPIVNTIDSSKLFYLKDSDLWEIDGSNIVIANFSIFDSPENYPSADMIDDNMYKIALYHGQVNGAVDYIGGKDYVIKNSKIDINIFNGYDIVLLGDIHKRGDVQRFKTIGSEMKLPTIAYAGSLVQNRTSETLDNHGILVWDLDKRYYDFIEIENDYGYVNLNLDNYGDVINLPLRMPKFPKITVNYNSDFIDNQTIDGIIKKLTSEYNPIELTAVPLSTSKSQTVIAQHTIKSIRNVDYQNEILSKYVQEHYNPGDDILKKIIELNVNLNQDVHNTDVRNTEWKPKILKFSNLFSYGEDNVIDFTKLNGIAGLFGSNTSGKSSAISALLFALFDKTDKTNKATNILNINKKSFNLELLFELSGQDYLIKKTGKKDNNLGSVSVKVEFYKVLDDGELEDLSGEQRKDTVSIISQYIGTFDDFSLTALSSQINPSNIVDRTQAERKDLLSSFLDISIYEDLHTISNKKMLEINAKHKQYEINKYLLEVDQVRKLIADNEIKLGEMKLTKQDKERDRDIIDNKIKNLLTKLEKIDDLKESIDFINNKISDAVQNKENSESLLSELESNLSKYMQKKSEIETQRNPDAILEFKKRKSEYDAKNLEYINKKNLLKQFEIQIKNKLEKTKKLRELQYDENCEYCMNNIFVKDAIESKRELANDKIEYVKLKNETSELEADLLPIKESIEKEDEQLTILEQHLSIANRKISELLISKNKYSNDINNYNNIINEYTIKKDVYETNSKKIELNKKINMNVDLLKSDLKKLNLELGIFSDNISKLNSRIEIDNDRIKQLEEKIQEYYEIDELKRIYNIYVECVHRDSIPYKIIEMNIPLIEHQVNQILSQIVDFRIQIILDGKNVNLYILYNDKSWLLEQASGMERFISSIAIKVALTDISTLPKPSFLIIDEGFSALDPDNMSNLPLLFDYLRNKFEFVWIISHMDFIRDFTDFHMDIKKDNGFSMIVV